MRDAGCGVRDARFGIRDPGFGIRGNGFLNHEVREGHEAIKPQQNFGFRIFDFGLNGFLSSGSRLSSVARRAKGDRVFRSATYTHDPATKKPKAAKPKPNEFYHGGSEETDLEQKLTKRTKKISGLWFCSIVIHP